MINKHKEGGRDLIIIFVPLYWHHKWLTENIFFVGPQEEGE